MLFRKCYRSCAPLSPITPLFFAPTLLKIRRSGEPSPSAASICRLPATGSVTPWLIAAKGVIANGCTTMVEAAVLDTPAVAYQPVVSEEFDDDLPNALSHRVFSIEELCDRADKIAGGTLGPVEYTVRRKILDQHIAAIDGPTCRRPYGRCS